MPLVRFTGLRTGTPGMPVPGHGVVAVGTVIHVDEATAQSYLTQHATPDGDASDFEPVDEDEASKSELVEAASSQGLEIDKKATKAQIAKALEETPAGNAAANVPMPDIAADREQTGAAGEVKADG